MAKRDGPVVVVVMPRSGARALFDSAMIIGLASRGRCTPLVPKIESSSLVYSFNAGWQIALDLRDHHGATHLAMMHDDVCPIGDNGAPLAGWLDAMIDAQARAGAMVLSAVIPIKTLDGTTSTAVGYDDPFVRRRLTLKEIFELPETFDAADVRAWLAAAGNTPQELEGQDPVLLINTGLWVADLRGDWQDDVIFTQHCRVTKLPDRRKVQLMPEDWAFSRYLHSRGVHYCATRKIAAKHVGDLEFRSDGVWGADRDEMFFKLMTAREAAEG
jgi:hypothetical protein